MYSIKRKKGNVGEDIVVSYLENVGFKILDRNYLKKCGEIDVVAEKSKKVYFIEVKSSVLSSFNGFSETNDIEHWKIIVLDEPSSVSCETEDGVFNPVWNMTNKKKSNFSKIIKTYLADKYGEAMPEFQIDLVSVLLDFYKKIAYINRIENVLLENN